MAPLNSKVTCFTCALLLALTPADALPRAVPGRDW
jgi:hypothetical protein